ELIPKYLGVSNVYATAYRRPVGELIYQTLEYFHAAPETVVNMRPYVVSSGEPGAKTKKEIPNIVTRNRTRQVFIIPDPLAPLGASMVRGDILNQKEDLLARRVGDDYIVVIGPSRNANMGAIREALIRFVIDPIIERHLKNALQYKDEIAKLVGGIATANK